jgi:hypothetical protein
MASKKIQTDKINALKVKNLLRKKYPMPEYEIFFEVSSSTGNGNNTRYADAVAFNTFSSRGYKITGFEIKVNRSDLLKELKSPEKAEEIFKYCDEWYLVVANNILKETDEVPDNWGIMEINEKSKIKVLKKSKKNPNVILDRKFVASLLREKNRPLKKEISEAEKLIREEYREKYSKMVENEVQRRLTNPFRNPETVLAQKIRKIISDNPEKFENFGGFFEFNDKLIERCLMLCKTENELDIIERQMKYNIEYYRKQIEKLQKIQENLLNVTAIK